MTRQQINSPGKLGDIAGYTVLDAIAAIATGKRSLKPAGIFRNQTAVEHYAELTRIEEALSASQSANPAIATLEIGELPGFPEFKEAITWPPPEVPRQTPGMQVGAPA